MAKKTNDHSFSLKLDLKKHRLEATTLIHTLQYLSLIVQEINAELNIDFNSDVKIDMKIRLLHDAEFSLRFELSGENQDALGELLSEKQGSVEKYIVQIFHEILDIKSFLKGKPAEKVQNLRGNNVQISGENSKKMSVDKKSYEIYARNSVINDALDKNFELFENESELKKVSFANPGAKEIIEIPREKFSKLSIPNELLEYETEVAVIPGTRLSIFKIVFDGKYKWQFYYRGIRISAKIIDEQFFQQIDEGEKFAKGDTIICELQINKIFDPAANTFVNKSYQVNKVLQHIPRGEQGKLEF